MAMGHREKTKAGEKLVFSGWRKLVKYARKPGVVTYWKHLFARRVRREERERLRKEP
jgi:hypothetical protein